MRHDTIDLLDAKADYERDLTRQFGPKPINIFKRLRQSLDLSHEHLASLMYTSKQSLIRLEQGTYDEPLPVALEWWTQKSGISGVTELALVHQYEDFQEQMRQRHKGYFGRNPILRLQIELLNSTTLHPLVTLRDSNDTRDFHVSVTEVSKALCLHQSTLQHWESKWRLQKTVPRGFQQCFVQLGYSGTDLRKFCEYYIQWRQVKLGRL